jgi:predicted HTH domain antitoxin
MKELLLSFPDDLDFDSKEMTVFLAAKLYEDGKLSMGKAAEMAGVYKWDFPKILSQFGIPLFNYPEEELDEDVCNAHNFARNANNPR